MSALLQHAPTAAGRTYDDLTEAEFDQIGRTLDALREEVLAGRAPRRGVHPAADRRAAMPGGRRPRGPARQPPPRRLVARHRSLALSKILDNMEIGHNVLHGQWDWMRDPRIHSSTWEWDHASAPAQWKRAHNDRHHVNTNVVGKDNDLGYGIMRVDETQEWSPRHLAQPLLNLVNACIFEYGIAMYDLDLGETLRPGESFSPEQKVEMRTTASRVGRSALRDYVLHPLLSAPTGSARTTLTANLVANLTRNVWSHSVIMCGHFPEGVATFEVEDLDEAETRGRWYVRQMLGSADISGPWLVHLLCGNLSHQIEHHLFPDLPSNRYAEIAGPVRELFERHGLPYNAASLPRQVASAWHKVLRMSLPPRVSAT